MAKLETFGDTENKFKMLTVLIILWITLVALFGATGLFRKFLEGQVDDDEDEMASIAKWHDQSKDTGTDFAAMGSSFLIVFWIRFMIMGELPSINGELGASPSNGNTLFGLGLLFLAIAAALGVAHHNNNFAGFFDYVSTTIADSAAFLLIFSLMWKIGHAGSTELMGQTLVAVVLTIMAVLYIVSVVAIKTYIIDSEAETKAFNAMYGGVALSVGLSWEKVFDVSMDAFADYVTEKNGGEEHSSSSKWLTVAITYFFVIIVAPAWTLYILPKANGDIQKDYSKALAEGPLPLDALCGDDEYHNDYLGEEDDEFGS